ncbi:Eukaryotic aspartyl protease family protein [Rhynchospora pubera]|uniref:Eukaryotic aspartyl protease family protein n=1 Tax=Rhynchospora pubera TaxID=906938 RepID=A0AAV8DAS1_9POAL|nr:Eukaryotic aspartyl protease family protein [Rhynchospora pubera]
MMVQRILCFCTIAVLILFNTGVCNSLTQRSSTISSGFSVNITSKLPPKHRSSFIKPTKLDPMSFYLTIWSESIYMAQILIGTPSDTFFVHLDTGSPITWIQDKYCNPCVNNTFPGYDASQSSSVSPIDCDDGFCYVEHVTTACDEYNDCTIELNYLDSTYAKGEYRLESLSFLKSEGGYIRETVPIGFATNTSVRYNDGAVGIMGLSRHSGSFIDLLRVRYLSFCLPTAFTSKVGGLKFGLQADLKGVIVPMIQGDSFYSLNLKSLNFDGQKIDGFGNQNVIFDTGSTMTLVPKNLFDPVLKKILNKYVYLEEVKGALGSRYCNYGSTTPYIPPITWKFQGLEIVSTSKTLFIVYPNGGRPVFCFNIVGTTSNEIIFSSFLMQNINFGIDIGRNLMYIQPNSC